MHNQLTSQSGRSAYVLDFVEALIETLSDSVDRIHEHKAEVVRRRTGPLRERCQWAGCLLAIVWPSLLLNVRTPHYDPRMFNHSLHSRDLMASNAGQGCIHHPDGQR